MWIAAITVVSTVLAVAALFAGLKRIGPTAASIISTIEPVCAVALAYVIFGESLAALQLLGAATVIGALVVLQATKQASRHPGVAPGERATPGSLVGHTGFGWSHPPGQPPPDRKL